MKEALKDQKVVLG